MSKTRIRTATLALAAGAVISSALAGCSISRDDEPQASPETSTEEPTVTEEPTAEATPTPTATVTLTPSAQPSPTATSAPPAATLPAALLAATELPQLNPTSRWTLRRTGPVGQESFGLCQKFDLLTIGALDAVERTYAAGKDSAGQQVAEFPDAKNALRASKVIEAWHRDCAGRVQGKNVKVRPITDVAVPAGKGWSYLVSYERQGTGQFHSLGLALSGTRMSLVRIDHSGQDHNYAPGKDPVELALKAVSARLG